MRLIFVFVVALLCLPLAKPDGCYFAKTVKIPEMPYQRAIVAYRDGVQKMAIESTFNAPDADVSWVVPIPSVPTSVDVGDSHLVDRIARFARPLLEGAGSPGWTWSIFALSPLLFVTLTAPFRLRKRKGLAKQVLKDLIYATLLCFLLFFFFFPVYAQPKSLVLALGGVENVYSKDVGEYHVNVIRGQDAKWLVRWLETNHTPLPDKALPIVEDYVANGWCFLVAKLRAQPDAIHKPHPLVVTFPTKEPVYPMRLTGLIPGDLVLDLFVIADGTAEVPGQLMWASIPTGRYPDEDEFAKQQEFYFDFRQLAWPKAHVTRFQTMLSPGQMKEDYPIRIGSAREYKRALWTRQSAIDTAGTRAVFYGFIASLATLTAGLVFSLDSKRWAILTYGAVALAALVGYLSLILTVEILV